MIKLTLFDLGETLVHENMPIPHAVDTLELISAFTTQDGAKLELGIISNFGNPEDIESEEEIQNFETEFASILKNAGIENFFQPFASRVTISARAKALKPDRAIFAAAAARSGVELSECLFITEDRDHLEKARTLGMSILGFGNMQSDLPEFSDWQDAPAQIAKIVTPDHDQNFEKVLTLRLKQQKGIGNFKCLTKGNAGFRGQGTQLLQLVRPELGELSGAFIEMPVQVSVHCDADGRITSTEVDEPANEDINEAFSFVQNLARRGQLNTCGAATKPGETHAIETDANGRRIIVRQRYYNQ